MTSPRDLATEDGFDSIPLQEYRDLFNDSLDGLFITGLDGSTLDINPKGLEILGYEDKAEAFAANVGRDIYFDPGQHDRVLRYVDKYGVYEYEIPVRRKDGVVIDAHVAVTGVRGADGKLKRLRGAIRDVTEQNEAERHQLEHVHFLESMDRVNRALNAYQDQQQAIAAVLDELLSIFDCDRAWLLYPCNPEAPTWRVEMERTRPEWPSLQPIGMELPLDPIGAVVYRVLRDARGPVQWGPGGKLPVPDPMWESFHVRSFVAMAFWPRVGDAWSFGLHQCTSERIWSPQELRLLEEIGRRLADALTTQMAISDMRSTKERLARIFNSMEEGLTLNRLITDDDGVVVDYEVLEANPAFLRDWSMKREDVVGRRATEIHPQLTRELIIKFWKEHGGDTEANVMDRYAQKNNRWYRTITTVAVDGEFLHSFSDISELVQAKDQVQRVLYGMIDALAEVTEKRDPYTAGHQHRVAELATAIGQQLGLELDRIEGVRIGASVHDIGKISVPAELLARPGALSDYEWDIVRTHPQAGAEIVQGVQSPWPLEQMILEHHERLDGSGYPRGLTGDEMLLESRIIAVADVVEAMMSHRPYRPALAEEEALTEIAEGAGTRYDADVAAACLELFRNGFEFSESWA
jgi:PAS domain S-box-containing protein